MHGMLAREGGRAMHRLGASRAVRTAAGANSGARSFVMDEKTRSEMRSLHLAEPGRWTAGALAARFGAPVENAAAVVRLARRRPAEVSEAAARVEAAWIDLSSGPRGRGRAHASPSPVAAAVAEPEPEEVMEEEEGDTVGTTPTADWARGKIAAGEVETVRKTTYAFIEAGKGVGAEERAVWMRDARTGKLRAPTKEERHVLLGLERVYPS